MDFFIPIRIVLLIVAVIFNLILSFFVLKNNARSATNRIFFVMALIISVWLLANGASIEEKFLDSSHFWIRASFFWAAPMTLLFFILAHTAPKEQFQMSKKLLRFLIAITVFVMFLSISPFAIIDVDLQSGIPKPVTGWGILPFGILAIFFTVSPIVILFSRFKRAVDIEKKQLKIIISGMVIMQGLIISTVFIPSMFYGESSFVSLMPLYTLVFLSFTTYAIIRHGLFDIKVLTSQLLVIVLSLIMLINFFASKSVIGGVFNFFIFISVVSMGGLLVKSVMREVKRREEVAHLAHKLERANLRLKELDEIKTEFMSIASHQLRTPLTVIKGFVSLIQEGAYGKTNEKIKEVLKNIYETNEHLIHLVDDFLNISRIEQGRAKYEFKKMDLTELINGVIVELAIKVSAKNLKIIFGQQGEKIEIVADSEKIRHVIYNFIDNAIKYTEKGVIKIIVDKEDGGHTLRVIDTGIGFDKIDHANFFQKFYRGKNTKRLDAQGVGMGLYVCRKFIEGHGGKIWAKSKGPQKGSEFGFWLKPKPAS